MVIDYDNDHDTLPPADRKSFRPPRPWIIPSFYDLDGSSVYYGLWREGTSSTVPSDEIPLGFWEEEYER